MCELLGMSANTPTDIRFSFSELTRRGGLVGPHRDGWGITFYQGKGEQTFKEVIPSADSPFAHYFATSPIKAINTIAHIRQANRGGLRLENTHPFTRQLWGRNWTFAHNGQLHDHKTQLPLSFYQPIGTTDSEWVFCHLMEHLQTRYTRPQPRLNAFKSVGRKMREIATMGVFNALMTDGRLMLAYCATQLHYLTRRAPFSQAALQHVDWEVDFGLETSETDVVTVIATQPLTRNEQWTKMQAGEYLILKDGEILYHYRPRG